MRTNNLLPFILALALHLLPLSYLLKNWTGHTINLGPTGELKRLGPSIDLNQFSINRSNINKSAHNAATQFNSNKPLSHNTEVIDTGINGNPNSSAGDMNISHYEEPNYPPIAKKSGYEGVVKIRAQYNKEGSVENVQVIQTSGYKILDESVVKSVYNWKLTVKDFGFFEKTFEFKLKN